MLLFIVVSYLIGGAEAEAELAALEELRLSRAMAYVSINPSSVGERPAKGMFAVHCVDLYVL